MRRLFSLAFCFFFISGYSQIIKTKDDVSLGSRSDFMKGCINGFKEDTVNLEGIRVNKIRYCSCVCDNLIPTLTSQEIEDAIKNNTLLDLFLEDKNLKLIMACLKGNVTVDSNYQYKNTGDSSLTKRVAIKSCVDKIMENSLNSRIWTPDMAESYCACAINKLFERGYQLKDINNLIDKNSEAFNEIIVPCVNMVLKNHPKSQLSNRYNPENVTGSDDSTEVPLTDYLNKGYKLKISIDGITYYFLLDTGASDLIINSEIEKRLIARGLLKKEDYVGTKMFTLADDTQIKARIVRLRNIKIGNFIVKDAVGAIFENGLLLCGKGFLDNFRKWKLDKEGKILVLFK